MTRSSMLTIRQFRDGDEDALWRVFASAIRGVASGDYTPEQIEAWAPAEGDRAAWRDRVRALAPFVAERAGQIVGYADVQPSGYIDHFFVAADAMHQGVGARLMQEIHAAATARRIDSLFADVSVTAQPFFARWGFALEDPGIVSVRGVAMENCRMRKALFPQMRPAAPGDVDAWARMRVALWPDATAAEHRADCDRFFTGDRREPAEVLFACDRAGAPIGFVELSIRNIVDGCSTDHVGYLEGWYVEPAERRRGVGRALIAAAEQWALAQGCSEFASDALADDEVSRLAHEAMGFEESGVVRNYRKELRGPSL